MTSIGHHFYRKRRGFAILALLALAAGISLAQLPKKEKGPRALAVVELSADGKAAVRLTPIAILVSGRFWDASIYRADPRPFALDPGNVYEVERSGKPLGFFTINEARQMQSRWIAQGNWQPEVEKPAAKPAKPAKVQEPVDDDRPVLHRRESASPAQETQPAAKNSPASVSAPAAPPPDDPNRPVLRRGRPTPPPREQQPEEKPEAANQPAGKTSPPAAAAKEGELLAAISDAGGPDPRSYTYPVQPDEQKKLTKAVTDIATAEVARYVKNTPALHFAPAANLDQAAVHVFDLDSSNNPHVVLTARVPAVAAPLKGAKAAKTPAPDFSFYVTVVGQTDLYGQMRKLFSSVTDSGHLDAFPRLELIDAVDAEGTGRGNLLFRAWSGSSPSYELYHVGPDSLRKLFDSGGE